MDFGQGGGGGFVSGGETSMANLLHDYRHRSNSSDVAAADGALKPCRSVLEMGFCKSRDDDDRAADNQNPMKLARTDSFPFDLKMHNQHQQMMRNNLGYGTSNSTDGSWKNELAFYTNRIALMQHHQQPYPYKTSGLPLSMERGESVSNIGMGMGSYGTAVQRSRFCFTASQWQELEHQALIFKYMTAGIPVPSDLVIPIQKSLTKLTGLSALSAPRHLTNKIFLGQFILFCQT